ncbi:Cys-tRNA(Pro) deacylase [Nocardioidaceae bacterium]|nr:Cys-tRNA(Pro) deacylase [Nocardioidaceae bacterium]
MASAKSGATPALRLLARSGVPHEVRAYDHDPAVTDYGLEAAQALDVDPARVFKTLLADLDGELVVAVVPVTGRLDLKALAAALGGKKATMADPKAAERTTGYVVGGISPLGQKKRLRTVVDRSAEAYATVLVSAGRRGLDVELRPADLVGLTGAGVAVIAAG